MSIFTKHLIILSAIISITTANAQQLNNTRWKSYSIQLHTFDMFWNFQNDTLATSPDNITWTNTSVYTEAGLNAITFRDIDDFQCDTTLYGIYHFDIVHDTMTFEKVSEPCHNRLTYDTTHYFVDFPIGINELEPYRNVSVFPVPFTDELHVKAESGSFNFSLYDITGREVIVKSFDELINIETGHLEPGMYLYKLAVDGRVVKSGTAVKY